MSQYVCDGLKIFREYMCARALLGPYYIKVNIGDRLMIYIYFFYKFLFKNIYIFWYSPLSFNYKNQVHILNLLYNKKDKNQAAC